jgi:hypothetical protein
MAAARARKMSLCGINLLYGFPNARVARATLLLFLFLFQSPSGRGRFDRVDRRRVGAIRERVGRKPGSVVGNHSSGMRVAAQL